jgi:exocyst complex component 2
MRQAMRRCDWQSHSTYQITTPRPAARELHVRRQPATMDPSLEQAILNKYNLTTLWPTRWPDEKNEDSDSDVEAPTKAAPQPVHRSKSRYSVLEDRSRFSRQVPGAEISKDGKENLVQKDEQDPLGMYPSVVQVLRTRNIQVEEDIKLRMCRQYEKQ